MSFNAKGDATGEADDTKNTERAQEATMTTATMLSKQAEFYTNSDPTIEGMLVRAGCQWLGVPCTSAHVHVPPCLRIGAYVCRPTAPLACLEATGNVAVLVDAARSQCTALPFSSLPL